MNALHALHFLRPWWLLTLAVLPVLPWLVQRSGQSAALRRLVDAALLPHLVEGGAHRRWVLLAAVLAAWTLAALALAGPTWERMPQPVFMNQRAQVVAVSLSQRMLATDVSPDRMTRVRYKVHALLQANKGGQNALIAYAGESFTVAPLTADASALGELLNALAPDVMPVQGDDMSSAIHRATRLLKGAGVHDGSIVVVDDHADVQAISAARAAHAAGMRVSVLGVGTVKGAPVPQARGGFERTGNGQTLMAKRDDASLRAVAQAGGGRYVPMQADNADIQALASQLRTQSGPRDTRQHAQTWRDRGPWLLLPVLLLAAFGFRRGVLLMLPLLLLSGWSLPVRAQATTWQNAWHTRDQQAAKALAEGHAREAQKLAQDPALRGTAAYRAGDYRTAAKSFAQAKGAQNEYNRGNALVHMHRYQEAIKAYDQALAADPGLNDARTNRKSVQDWLRKQRKSQGNGQGEQRDQGGKGGGASPQNGQSGQAKNGSGSSHRAQDQSKSPNDHAPSHGAKDNPSGKGQQKGSASDAQRARDAAQGKGKSGQDASKEQPSRASQSQDKQAERRAQQALKKRMDAQLGKTRSGAQKAYALGTRPKDASGQGKSLPQAMQQALQRVPDDPGGLLRRKFQLEYQRRQQRGDGAAQTDTDGSD
ncbi:VWA domain-containing protein [Oleiagrimonas citrea]|uniref:VWA domain-containing protein n=1 Tax=Oleiagrimonas citrea TaxID=1665687 RepID=A0A846ZPP3_9GAMM|nr:VWA domain-containing protein [Oleiagrimonas citrea]NKZ39413.1 VWA domain-containing protein [Oleiagrimonas citrea]